MNLMTLLDMAVAGFGDRVANGPLRGGYTFQQLEEHAASGASLIVEASAQHVLYIAPNGFQLPVALFASAWAGVPFVPLNYRLGHDQLQELVDAHPSALVIVEREVRDLVDLHGRVCFDPQEWLVRTGEGQGAPSQWSQDPDAVALLLYTSGTTATPKAAVLRHRHLSAYVLGTVEFASAAPSDASLVSVPPYHVAGIANTVSNLFAGRRVVHLESFSPATWLETVRAEGITHALVVPTMLARVVEYIDERGATSAEVPALRTLAYGGAPMPARTIERALALFPATDFVNAYGLTETSSTIALLGPDDHRSAARSDDPAVRARLGSAGRIVPGVEVEIRGPEGEVLANGEAGELFVRGEQVSGEYLGRELALDELGWFPTRDRAHLDADGYLFLDGRADDTIIRGGENIAPAEIEAVLTSHDGVAQAAVVGLPDEEWGQVIAAVVVPETGVTLRPGELREWTRERLRGSKTPDRIELRSELPYSDTGKVLRRTLVADLIAKDAL